MPFVTVGNKNSDFRDDLPKNDVPTPEEVNPALLSFLAK
jgi:hypothetical protein